MALNDTPYSSMPLMAFACPSITTHTPLILFHGPQEPLYTLCILFSSLRAPPCQSMPFHNNSMSLLINQLCSIMFLLVGHLHQTDPRPSIRKLNPNPIPNLKPNPKSNPKPYPKHNRTRTLTLNLTLNITRTLNPNPKHHPNPNPNPNPNHK